MKLPGLIDLSLILIVASQSQDHGWRITVDSQINATVNSDVIIKCHVTIPTKFATENPKLYWKKNVKGTFVTEDKNDRNAFVYHPNATYVLEKYREKTELIGDIKNGDCTLKIKKIEDSDNGIYLRVIAVDSYSFKKNSTTINVDGRGPVTPIPNAKSESITFELTTVKMPEMPLSTTMYIAIFVPIAALLLIIFITGIVFWRKRRSKTFAREGSGYYANFRRASSNQDKRDASFKTQDTKKLPESKNIDEPVYINFEAQSPHSVPPGQIHQSNDHTDNVYANVDYLKK